MLVGSNLRRLRKERGLGQDELAKFARSSQQTISEIENGKRDPKESTLERLAVALGVGVGAFYAADRTAPPVPPRPQTPLTDEKHEDFDERFAATDAEGAEALQAKVDAEFEAIRQYIKALKAAGVGDDEFKLKQARARRDGARRRFYATRTRANNLALNADFGREQPIYDTVEAYVGPALEAEAFYGEEQARHDSAQRVEQSGEAG